MLCTRVSHAIDSGFKWTGSMITRMGPFFYLKKKKKILRACKIFENTCSFGKDYFCQLILLFSLFLLLFMVPLHFFATIHRSYYTISVNFYLHLQYFQQKKFNFNKINRSQTNIKQTIIFFFFFNFLKRALFKTLKNSLIMSISYQRNIHQSLAKQIPTETRKQRKTMFCHYTARAGRQMISSAKQVVMLTQACTLASSPTPFSSHPTTGRLVPEPNRSFVTMTTNNDDPHEVDAVFHCKHSLRSKLRKDLKNMDPIRRSEEGPRNF